MRIRPEQFDVFQPRADEQFVGRVVEHLRRAHPDVVGRLPAGVLCEMAQGGLARARRYGLTLESSITAFITLMFLVAPNFDEHPLIRHVLSDERLQPDERVAALRDRVSPGSWEKAERRYDPRAWFPELREEDGGGEDGRAAGGSEETR